MNVLAIAGSAAALTFISMGVTRQTGLEGRMATMEEAAKRSPKSAALDEMQARIDSLTQQLAEAAASAEPTSSDDEMKTELEALKADLTLAKASLASKLATQKKDLESVQALARKAERIDEVQAVVDTRWDGMAKALEAQSALVQEAQNELLGVRERFGSSHTAGDAWIDMVGPTVQLAGDATVGSGVLLKSQPIAGKDGEFQTLLLTSWHVVRDIRADAVETDSPIPVMIRDDRGQKRRVTATLIAHDTPLDAALLLVDSTERFDVGALLPTRERLRAARVFDEIVAVGCPLGNDPIPTQGHLSDLFHSVSTERFWMISAPTYIGNSGGGIYSGTSHELLGIFSKIYTHGAIRPTVIPHMGLVTPLEEFYNWLDSAQVAEVIEGDGETTIVVR